MMRKMVIAMMFAAAPVVAHAGKVSGTVDKFWRLDCGAIHINQLNAFSDTQSYPGQSRDLVSSCYLIKDGDAYMLWDTGLPATAKGTPNDPRKPMSTTLRKTIVEQLAEIGVKPEQIGLIGISHYHFDHTGQAAGFPNAKLLIGLGDLEAARKDATGIGAAIAPWLGADAKVEGVGYLQQRQRGYGKPARPHLRPSRPAGEIAQDRDRVAVGRRRAFPRESGQ
jgi:glyoxylase-like metal-dependent hydrolase (beta-lactamase superfamily II)